jgi:hypothetical protein
MKLQELFFHGAWPDLTPEEEDRSGKVFGDIAAKGPLLLSKATTLWWSDDTLTYVARRGDTVLGWLVLVRTEILGKSYLKVGVIYIKKTHRGTRLLPAMLTAIRGVVSLPVVLGDDSDGGGLLFQQGRDLVFDTFSRMGFLVKVLNTSTGEVKDLQDCSLRDIQRSYVTLLFEQVRGIPLYKGPVECRAYVFEDA